MVRSGLLGPPTTSYQMEAESVANGGYVTTSDYFWRVDQNNKNCACGKKAFYAKQTLLMNKRQHLYGYRVDYIFYCEDHFRSFIK